MAKWHRFASHPSVLLAELQVTFAFLGREPTNILFHIWLIELSQNIIFRRLQAEIFQF